MLVPRDETVPFVLIQKVALLNLHRPIKFNTTSICYCAILPASMLSKIARFVFVAAAITSIMIAVS